MSKRGMDNQGGAERYGAMDNERDTPDDKPKAATAAQMARRKIMQTKGRASARPSRQGSPAVAGPAGQATAFQSFQPPPSANGFSFSMAGSTPAPSFGQAAPHQNGFGTPAPEQTNGTPTFGGFGGAQNGATTSFASAFGTNNSQPQQSSFNPSPAFSFGQTQPNGATTTPATSFNLNQEPPKQNGFKPSTSTSFGGFGGQQPPQQNGATSSFSFGQTQPQEQAPTPSTPFPGIFGAPPAPVNGDRPASSGLFGSTPAASAAPKSGESIFSGISSTTNGIKPGMFTASQPNGEQTPKPAANPFAGFSFGQTDKAKELETPKPALSFGQQNGGQGEQQTQKSSLFAGQQGLPNGAQTPKPQAFTGFGQQPAAQTNGEHTPQPGNAFAGFSFGQTPAEKKAAEPEKEAATSNNVFSMGQKSAPEASATPTPFKFGQTQEQQTPKPAGDGFGGLGQSQPTGPSAFKFGAAAQPQQEDESMMSLDNTPQKPGSMQAASQAAPSAASEIEAPAAGKSLFDRITSEPAATTPKPPTFAFGASASEQSAPSGTSLFERSTPRESEAPSTALKHNTASFGTSANPSNAPPPPPLFNAPSAPRGFVQSAASAPGKAAVWGKVRQLNEAVLAHLKTEDSGKDWSEIFLYYLGQVGGVTGTVAAAEVSGSAAAASGSATSQNGFHGGGGSSFKAPAPSSNAFHGGSGSSSKAAGPAATFQPQTPSSKASGGRNESAFNAPAPTPTVPTPAASGSNTFSGASVGFNSMHSRPTPPQPGMVSVQAPAPPGRSNSAQQKPETPGHSNMFSQFATKTPATAPVNRKRSADDDLMKDSAMAGQPVTEKRARAGEAVQYPRLAQGASKTAQLFASSLGNGAGADKGRFGPPDATYSEVQKQRAAKEAPEAAGGASVAAGSASVSAFTPSTFRFGASTAVEEKSGGGSNGIANGVMPSTVSTWKPAEGSQGAFGGFVSSTPAVEKLIEAPETPSFGFKASIPAAGKTTEAAKTPSFSFGASTPAIEKTTEAAKTPSFGFKPSTSTAAAPATGGFKPAFAAPASGSANFLSSFGQKAESEQAKAMKRRMDEDYDSDDEDKASWEAKDRAEQEAKRRGIEEAAKSGPVFALPAETNGKAAAAAAAPFAFKAPGVEDTAEQAEKATPELGKSLFDRLTPADKEVEKAPFAFSTSSAFASLTPGKEATPSAFSSKAGVTGFSSKTDATGFGFGQPKASMSDSSKAEANMPQEKKDSGSGNNTWTPSTPIKFGALASNGSTTPAAPPPQNPFAGLFGSTQTSKFGGGELGKLAPPSVGFAFGAPNGASTDVSRATTPGLGQDGEASTNGDKDGVGEDGGPSDSQNDAQLDDMTRLLPEELEVDDLLYEVPMAKATKLDEKKTDDGYVPGWIEKGKGPLYLLKNKTTGKTRVVIKIPPLGRLAMNFKPMQTIVYETAGSGKVVRGAFLDHFDPDKEKAGKPSSWSIQVRSKEEAEEIVRVLQAEKENS
ncbi:hypothetical protein LTR08_001957 [Meristemomyces frigidus]|nr:hypothetical protein LTR08_001957 [Meristemomyces frigidus]